MNIIKYYKHQGNIDEISRRYSAFGRLKNARMSMPEKYRWKNTDDNSISYQALAVFIGKTGYGKSSTVNSFFGRSIMNTCDVAACTRECQSLDFKLSADCYFSLGDLPGIGENEYRDKEYLAMYRNFLDYSSIAVYVVRADTRDYTVDEAAYKELFRTPEERKKVIFAVNCCDKIEPLDRRVSVTPGAAQMKSISQKVDSIDALFRGANKTIPYSAATGWNMNGLAEEIVKVITNSPEVVMPTR